MSKGSAEVDPQQEAAANSASWVLSQSKKRMRAALTDIPRGVLSLSACQIRVVEASSDYMEVLLPHALQSPSTAKGGRRGGKTSTSDASCDRPVARCGRSFFFTLNVGFG